VRRIVRVIFVTAFGLTLVAGAGVSAGAISLPLPSARITPPPTGSPTWPSDSPSPSPSPSPTCPVEGNALMAPPTEADIRARYTAWQTAVGQHISLNVAGLYARDNAVLQPTFSPDVRTGRVQIRAYFTKLFEDHPGVTVSDAKQRTIKIFGTSGAADYGLYEFTPDPTKPNVVQKARYTFVYEWDDCRRTFLIVNHHSSVVPAG
jgi:uncharacterized protein (TIGR02246 family)